MSAAIQGIYIALFGRPADPGGLAYWTEVTKGGTDLSAMLSVLPNLTEYTARFEGQTPDQVITTVYQNLFGRAPDAEGLAFFKGQLASGAQTLATIAVNIMQGAQGDDKADVDAKVGAAELFTASLDTPEEIAAYSGADAAALAKKFLDGVDKDKPATPESVEKAAGAVVAGQDPTGGQAPGGGGGGGGGTPAPVDVATAVSDAALSTVASTENGKMLAGSGNPGGNFEKTTTSLSQIEIALKGYKRSEGDATNAGNVYSFDGNDKAGFAYSVASLGNKSIEDLISEGYSFHLKIDNDGAPGFGANSANLTLQKQVSNAGDAATRDSGYNWVSDSDPSIQIRDDQGTTSVTQNIQSPTWYGGTQSANGGLTAGEYSVSLEIRKSGSVVATEQIMLDVNPEDAKPAVVGSLSNIATKGDGTMINGSGNTASKFNLVTIDLNQDGISDIELGLGAQQRRGDTIDLTGGKFAFASGLAINDAGDGVPMFKFSVASLNGNSLASVLGKYDIRLSVDQDGSANTNFITLNAVNNANASTGALDWQFADQADLKLTDDQGTSAVSQNIQALGWYQPELFGTGKAAYESADGTYTVRLEFLEKNTTNVIGINSVDFVVGDVA